MHASKKQIFTLTLGATLFFVASLHATPLTWDADPTTVSLQDGTNVWDTTTNTWWDGAANVAWNNATPDSATFGTTSGTAGAVTVAAGLTINVGNLTFNPPNAGNYNLTPGDATSRLSFTPGSIVTVASGLVVTNTVVLAGTSSFTKAGPGTFSLRPSTANTNSGITIVTDGALVMGSSGGRVVIPGDLIVTNTGDARLGAANTITNTATISVASGATFEMNGNALAVSGFVLNGGTVTQTTAETLTATNFDARSGSIIYNGVSTGSKLDTPFGGTFTKSTAGVVTLQSKASSTSTGGLTNTIIIAGTLVLDYSVTASGKFNKSGSLTMNGGTLIFSNYLAQNDTLGSLILNNGVITNASANAFDIRLGTGGNFDVRTGAVYMVLGSGTGQRLTKSTPGLVILAADNTYSGGTTISAGTLQLGVGGTSGLAGSASANITNNGTLVFNRSGGLTNFSGTISGTGAIIKTGSGYIGLTDANNSYTGTTTISNGVINIGSTSKLGDGTGALILSGGTLNITASRTTSTAPISNPLFVNADSAITTTNPSATVDLNFTNDSISGVAGTLTLRNDAASGTGVFQPRFSGSSFNFNRPIIIANGGFGTTRLNSFNLAGTTQTFSGNLSGNGGYRRTASASGTGGTTVLTGNNTYTGPTDVNDGLLLVNGTIGTNIVTVSSTATLGGNGTVNGPVTIQSGGTLAVGNSIGTLTISNSLVFQITGTNVSELNKTLGTNDLVRGLTAVTYNGILVVNNLSGTLAANDTFKLFDAGTYTGSFASSNLPALGTGLSWDTSGLTINGTLKVTGTTTASPQIGSVSLSGSNLILTGTGGTAGADYYVLTSTNVAQPLAGWTSIATNQFITGGNFNFTNAVDPAKPARFYILKVP